MIIYHLTNFELNIQLVDSARKRGEGRSSAKVENSSEEVISDGLISYIPFLDAVDDGSWPMEQEERARRHEANFTSLSSVVTRG